MVRAAILVLTLNTAYSVCASIPVLENIFPAGGQIGTTFTLTATGKFDPWPAKMWIDCSGVEIKPATSVGQYNVTISKDAPVGPHSVRVHNSDGASEVRTILIGRYLELLEKEPNDNIKQSQQIDSLPSVLNGRLQKSGDVDSYSMRIEAGRWLIVAVDGYALGSPMDPILHLLDEHGTKIDFNSDTHNLDPFIAYKVTRSGMYTIQIAAFGYPPEANVQFGGSAAFIYRLTLSNASFTRRTFPAGAQRGRKSNLLLTGWNLDPTATITVDATDTLPLTDKHLATHAASDRLLPILLSDEQEVVESEPNNEISKPQAITIPCAMNGRIDSNGDIDRFSFQAKKGVTLRFRLAGQSLHSQIDPWLRIEDSTGKQLAYMDDADTNVHDPQINWAAPADGLFTATIGDLYSKGSPDFRYRLHIAPPQPDFSVSVDNQVFTMGRGQTNNIKLSITVQNNGFTNLVGTVLGLPDGVTAKPVEIPPKNSDVIVSLVASPTANPASVPIRLMIAVTNSSPIISRTAKFNIKQAPIAGELLIHQIDQLWLTVTNAPPPIAKP